MSYNEYNTNDPNNNAYQANRYQANGYNPYAGQAPQAPQAGQAPQMPQAQQVPPAPQAPQVPHPPQTPPPVQEAYRREYVSPSQNFIPEPEFAPSYENIASAEPIKPKKRLGLKITALVLSCVLLGGALGAFAVTQITNVRNPQTEATSAASIEKASTTQATSQKNEALVQTNGTLSTPDIAELASPATVAIFTDTTQRMYGQSVEVQGSGSGVLISKDGYIVTNNHVVGKSTAISVTLSDGSEHEAQLIGTNEYTDVAVIKIKTDKDLPFLKFGNSSELRVGETVVAIGNPLGELQGTVSQGIVSALHRNVTIQGNDMKDLIQMDVAINSGNSGGALLNTKGELIGINVAKTSSGGLGSASVEGIAFAIPADTAYESVDAILNGTSTLRPMIGISGTTVTENIAAQYNAPEGIWVREVTEGSPAEKAGLKVGDVIVAFGEVEVKSITELNAEKNKRTVGDTVKVKVSRDGQLLDLDLVLGSSSY